MGNSTTCTSRRRFLASATGAVTAFTIVPRHVLGQGPTPPSEKLNIAAIGAGGQAAADIKQVARDEGTRIAALCDVDLRTQRRNAPILGQFPQAKVYQDFRKMLDEMGDRIDAVIVGTPDHTHAVASMAAMKRGKHVYCEKPLAHSVGEVRALMKAARQYQVVTQLGNQGHSSDTMRVFREWIEDGAIGNVHTIHCGCPYVNSALEMLPRLSEKEEVPDGLDWDLWLGPARERPYHSFYLPGRWRSWVPFGNGTIGDWACHVVDPPFWTFDLGAPKTITAQVKDYDPQTQGDTFPTGDVITFEFPAKGGRGPITLVWHSGQEAIPRPKELEEGRKGPNSYGTGGYVYGDKGVIMYGSHGADPVRIIPEEKMKAYKQPAKTYPRVRGHHSDWLRAIRQGGTAGSDFTTYGGPLTEIAMLGVIALKMPGTKLEWDASATRFTNCDEANRYLDPPYRAGWTL